MTGRITIKGPFPPPSPLLYPSGRKTASHVYQIFDGNGRKLMGGTTGADPVAALAYVLRLAAEKGLTNPAQEIIPG